MDNSSDTSSSATFARRTIHPTAVISSDAEIADGVGIGAFTVVHAGSVIGPGTTVGTHCVLGEPSAEAYADDGVIPRPCLIGPGSIVRSHTVVYEGVTTGPGFQTGHRVTVREGTTIGDDVRLGTSTDLLGDLEVRDHARLHSNIVVGAGSVIEEFAWIFPGVVFTNDPHPPSDTCMQGPSVGRFAVVATQVVLLPGVRVGEHALVGAGSLVTRDVPAHTVAVGTPARVLGSVEDVQCHHGVLDQVYPWATHFRRGYPDDALPVAADVDLA